MEKKLSKLPRKGRAEAIQRHRDRELQRLELSTDVVEHELTIGLKSDEITREIVNVMKVYYGLFGQESHTTVETATILKTNPSHVNDLCVKGLSFVLSQRQYKRMISRKD